MTPRAGKGPIRTLAASSSEAIVRLNFQNSNQPALESRHETRAAARLGAQTAAGPLRKYVLLILLFNCCMANIVMLSQNLARHYCSPQKFVV